MHCGTGTVNGVEHNKIATAITAAFEPDNGDRMTGLLKVNRW